MVITELVIVPTVVWRCLSDARIQDLSTRLGPTEVDTKLKDTRGETLDMPIYLMTATRPTFLLLYDTFHAILNMAH